MRKVLAAVTLAGALALGATATGTAAIAAPATATASTAVASDLWVYLDTYQYQVGCLVGGLLLYGTNPNWGCYPMQNGWWELWGAI